MAKKYSLPADLTYTQIKKQWGLPSLRAEQDPQKERLKRQPLQNITFQRQILDRDLSGGRRKTSKRNVSHILFKTSKRAGAVSK